MKGNRTRLFGALVFAYGVLEALNPSLIAGAFPAEYRGLIMAGIGIAVVILRQLTTTAPGKKS